MQDLESNLSFSDSNNLTCFFLQEPPYVFNLFFKGSIYPSNIFIFCLGAFIKDLLLFDFFLFLIFGNIKGGAFPSIITKSFNSSNIISTDSLGSSSVFDFALSLKSVITSKPESSEESSNIGLIDSRLLSNTDTLLFLFYF